MIQRFKIGQKVIVNTGGKNRYGEVVSKAVFRESGKQVTYPVIRFKNGKKQIIPERYIIKI